jgi:hypothetical protein
MRCAGILFVLCACARAQSSASLDGVATHALTHEPLSGVHVQLIAFSSDGLGVTNAYGAMSDRAGRFSIAALPPGVYILMPQYRGFLYAQKKQGSIPYPTVSFKPGEHRTDFTLEMIPRAFIGGRVLDEFGDPVSGAVVAAEPVSPEFVSIAKEFSMQTDDRGFFRFSGLPGKYYLKATVASPDGSAEIRTDGTSPPDYAPTYFPGVARKEGAAVVEARPGVEARGFDIRMSRAARLRTLSIRGVVTGVPASSENVAGGGMVVMRYGENAEKLSCCRNTQVDRDGKFTFSRLEPGFYRLTAMYYSGGATTQSATVDVTLDGADATNVELPIGGAGDLTGTLEIAGDPAGTPAEKRKVYLEPVSDFGFTQPGRVDVDPDGGFHFEKSPAGRFRLRIEPLPENAYIKSVQLDGAVAADGVLTLTGRPGSRVKVTISRNGAQITGAVQDKDGAVLVNSLAFVLLIDDPQKLDFKTRNGWETARVTPEGKYSFKGVRPGKYRLMVFDQLGFFDPENPDAIRKAAAEQEEFDIKEGDKLSKDLKALGQEDLNANAKK